MAITKDSQYARALIVFTLLLNPAHLCGGSFTLQAGGNLVDDASVISTVPFFNGGNYSWGNVTYFSSNEKAERYYIRIPIPALVYSTHCDSISQVNLKIFFFGVETPGFRICSQQVMEAWNEYTITWSNRPDNDAIVLDTLTLDRDSMWATFPITGVFKNWLCNERGNYGILLRALREGQGEQNLSTCWSSDYPDPTLRPILEIVSSELPDTLVREYITSASNTAETFLKGFNISQNYPNPFNSSTTLDYFIPSSSMASLKIYDTMGREVCVLVSGRQTAGTHHAQWDASGLPSGMYFAILQTETSMSGMKMVLLK